MLPNLHVTSHIYCASGFLQGPNGWIEVMKKKRAVHEDVIKMVQEQQSYKNLEKVNLSFYLFCNWLIITWLVRST